MIIVAIQKLTIIVVVEITSEEIQDSIQVVVETVDLAPAVDLVVGFGSY